MEKNKKTLIIIDGSSLIYRAFHAIPASFSTSKGLPTNAIYGFTQSLLKILKDYSPGYIGIAFDVKGPSFRHEMFEEYKAERPPMPDLLSVQIPYIKRVVSAFGIPVLQKESYEADDVIATLIKRNAGSGLKMDIVTGDKDMYQLVGDNTVILDYLSGKEYGPSEVEERFGIRPDLIRDLLALAGDTSDNIPGVPGIGFKTAAKLLKQFGSLEGVLEHAGEVSGEKLRKSLQENKDRAFLSRDLATLHPDVEIECTIDDLKYRGPDYGILMPLLRELEFSKILRDVMSGAEPSREDRGEYGYVNSPEELDTLAKDLRTAGKVSISINLPGEGGLSALHGIAVCTGTEKAFYISAGKGLSEEAITAGLREFLEDGAIAKDTDNSKALYLFFERFGVGVMGVDMDTSLASYILNPSKPGHSIEKLGYEFLGIVLDEKIPRESEEIKKRYCQKTFIISKLSEMLHKKLEEENLFELYRDIELPLSRVLAGMEIRGIKIDREKLRDLSKEVDRELDTIEKRIYEAAGTTFNINSPKQLSELLFEVLKLKPRKKTKTGFSTDEEVLTQLAAEHEVPGLILNFRQLSKLKSTYIDALLDIVNPLTGRIHTSFNQTVTATGRLSSSRPNLQNIPVRGEFAGRIREAFIPEEGYTFFSADYSQIELRIVAHMSQDPVLMDAFDKDEDVHTRTASEVFGIMPSLVTAEMRRRAKAINFGIIYGMGPFGLATELGISMKEATEYINNYFEHYRRVKFFMDETVEKAISLGYTTTLFGRRRFIPEIKSPVESTARLGARLAINTPIQGSAADMIKIAMIRIFDRLKTEGLRSKMILQVHDELVFEIFNVEREIVSRIVRHEMESVIELRVPIRVNTKYGGNWRMVE